MADTFFRQFDYAPVFTMARGTPSWTRLEPQSVSGDPRPGLEARVHDPLWLLCRQWQLGELEGEDAGSPVGVELATTSRLLTRWQAGDWQVSADRAAPVLPLAPGEPLEPVVEAEPGAVLGLRQRVDAGGIFVGALQDAGFDALADASVAQAGVLDETGTDPYDPSWDGLTLLTAGRSVDGRRLAAALEASAGAPGELPDWLVPTAAADRDLVTALAREWLAWYRELEPVADPRADLGSDAWVGSRLEYEFSVAGRIADVPAVGGTVPEEGVEVVLRAPEFVGGKLDWYHLDVDRSPGIADFSTPDDPVDAQVQTRYATPLRYAGMPADRLWQFEDSAVNLGGLESEPHDLARLLLVEYALSYGNDWLVVPVEVPAGSLTTIGWLTYTNTFGERFLVERPRARRPNDGWRMFTVAAVDEVGDDLPALLIPPAVVGHDDGQAIEEVLFLRDETANLAWAVERSVSAPSGDIRARSDEGTQPPPPIAGDTNAELDYRLQLGVPEQWIPHLPQTTGYRSIDLVQGRMRRADGTLVPPVGVLLNEPGTSPIADEEIPREGVRVRRVPVLARTLDGSYRRWTSRRVAVGRGEGSSGLAFDAALRRTSAPPP
jgi:hypothetical protein